MDLRRISAGFRFNTLTNCAHSRASKALGHFFNQTEELFERRRSDLQGTGKGPFLHRHHPKRHHKRAGEQRQSGNLRARALKMDEADGDLGYRSPARERLSTSWCWLRPC